MDYGFGGGYGHGGYGHGGYGNSPYGNRDSQNNQNTPQPGPPQPGVIREDMIRQALGFLNHEKVKTTASEAQKKAFLLQKGLTEEEITEALTRVGIPGYIPPNNTTQSQQNTNQQGGQIQQQNMNSTPNVNSTGSTPNGQENTNQNTTSSYNGQQNGNQNTSTSNDSNNNNQGSNNQGNQANAPSNQGNQNQPSNPSNPTQSMAIQPTNNPKFLYPPPAYLYQEKDDHSFLRTLMQFTGAISIGAVMYRWLQKNENWIEENTGINLGLNPTENEFTTLEDGTVVDANGNAIISEQEKLRFSRRELDELLELKLEQKQEEMREKILKDLKEEVVERHKLESSQIMSTLSQLMIELNSTKESIDKSINDRTIAEQSIAEQSIAEQSIAEQSSSNQQQFSEQFSEEFLEKLSEKVVEKMSLVRSHLLSQLGGSDLRSDLDTGSLLGEGNHDTAELVSGSDTKGETKMGGVSGTTETKMGGASTLGCGTTLGTVDDGLGYTTTRMPSVGILTNAVAPTSASGGGNTVSFNNPQNLVNPINPADVLMTPRDGNKANLNGNGGSNNAAFAEMPPQSPEEFARLEIHKEKISDLVKCMIKESTSKQDASKSLNMLFLVLENLRKHPTQDKYRKVNTSSARFKERFGNKQSASGILEYVGFTKKGFCYVYHQGDYPESSTYNKDCCPVEVATTGISSGLHDLDKIWDMPAPETVITSPANGNVGSAANCNTTVSEVRNGTVTSGTVIGANRTFGAAVTMGITETDETTEVTAPSEGESHVEKIETNASDTKETITTDASQTSSGTTTTESQTSSASGENSTAATAENSTAAPENNSTAAAAESSTAATDNELPLKENSDSNSPQKRKPWEKPWNKKKSGKENAVA